MELFYQKGLTFTCTQCSACCRHDEGYVFLSAEDLDRIAQTLNIPAEEVVATYCHLVEFGPVTRVSLRETEDFDCVFWENGCKIYNGRPLQCRSYPFWEANLSSERAWLIESQSCPGMNHGKLHTKEDIEQWQKLRDKEPLIDVAVEIHEGKEER